ncbi:MAG: hypothetical protein JJW01_00025 [Alphaproteobacteria bacterium]|nr:hypothetical protein [Rickettsiales bacterium]
MFPFVSYFTLYLSQMSAQSFRSRNNSTGGEVVELRSSNKSASSYYEPLFRDSVDSYMRSVDEVQVQVQQYQYSAQTSVQLARTLLSSNEVLLNHSEFIMQSIATEISMNRESMANFLLEQLSSNANRSQYKTDAILDIYNSILNLAKCATKLSRFTSLSTSGILDHHNLASEMSLNSSNDSDYSKIANFVDYSEALWERANRSASATQGVISGVLVLSQNALDAYNLSKQVTDKISSVTNSAAQFGGMN